MNPPVRILVVGPLDAPAAGNVIATRAVAAHLASVAQVVRLNTLVDDRAMWRGRLDRLWRYLLVWWRVLAAAMTGRADGLFLAMNSGAGIFLDLPVIALARLARWRIALHFHTANYLRRPSRRVAWLLAWAGRDAVAVVPSVAFAADLQRVYGGSRRAVILPLALDPPLPPRSSAASVAGSLRVGFFSNLLPGKGVEAFLAMVNEAVSADLPLRFVIAGRPMCAELATRVAACLAAHPDRVTFLGALDAAGRDAFLARLDVLCFLSGDESWGMVATEAMRHAVPVVTSGNRFVRAQFDRANVCEFDPAAVAFADRLAQFLAALAHDPEALAERRSRAARNHARLHGEWTRALHELAAVWLDPAVRRGRDLAPGPRAPWPLARNQLP